MSETWIRLNDSLHQCGVFLPSGRRCRSQAAYALGNSRLKLCEQCMATRNADLAENPAFGTELAENDRTIWPDSVY